MKWRFISLSGEGWVVQQWPGALWREKESCSCLVSKLYTSSSNSSTETLKTPEDSLIRIQWWMVKATALLSQQRMVAAPQWQEMHSLRRRRSQTGSIVPSFCFFMDGTHAGGFNHCKARTSFPFLVNLFWKHPQRRNHCGVKFIQINNEG